MKVGPAYCRQIIDYNQKLIDILSYRPSLLALPVELCPLLDLGGGLDEFLDDFVVVAVLAGFVVVGGVGGFVDLQVGGEVEVVGVDPPGGGGEDGVAVLLGPPVEDAREEGGVPALDLLVVGLDHHLLVEVVLDCVPQHQQVGVDALEFAGSEVGLALSEPELLLLLHLLLALLYAEQGQGYMMLYCSTWLEQRRDCMSPSMILPTAGLISMSSLKSSGSLLQQGSTSVRMWEKKMISNWLKWKVRVMCSSSSQGQLLGWLSPILCRISLDLYVNPLRTNSRSSYRYPLLLALALLSRPTDE